MIVQDDLDGIREHLDALAAPDGPYRLVCARTGETPPPVEGMRFDARRTAAEAADVAADYRSLLREYDPDLPFHDLVVCEAPAHAPAPERSPRVDQTR